MEVFEWVRHVLDTKTPSIEFESILVLLVNYGATSDQKVSTGAVYVPLLIFFH